MEKLKILKGSVAVALQRCADGSGYGYVYGYGFGNGSGSGEEENNGLEAVDEQGNQTSSSGR